MKQLSLAQWGVVIILALLTALEPLSIDLYLPGFLIISEALKTDVAAVQISLSTFLGGFAIGQLIWGPLADKYGRKKPILLSLLIFIIASIACIYVKTVEQLWIMRFIQAIGGCGGIVISRAVVSDYFEKEKTLKIFSLLAMIMGVAPIVAPLFGNAILQISHNWHSLFGAMAFIGIMLFLLTLIFLPETRKRRTLPEIKSNKGQVLRQYLEVLKVRKFIIYSLVAGIINGALMIYASNGPFLIMEKGGFSGSMFSLIFAINAFGLVLGSYSANILSKHFTSEKLCKGVLFLMTIISIIMLMFMYWDGTINIILFIIFFYLFVIGILFPLTTELALNSFTNNSGTASSLFGTIQMTIAFACTLISGIMNDGTIITLGIEFLLCAILAFISVFGKVRK